MFVTVLITITDVKFYIIIFLWTGNILKNLPLKYEPLVNCITA